MTTIAPRSPRPVAPAVTTPIGAAASDVTVSALEPAAIHVATPPAGAPTRSPSGEKRTAAPLPTTAAAMAAISTTALDGLIADVSRLAGARAPGVRAVFGEALTAAQALKSAVAVEMPLRAAVLTGKANPLQAGGGRATGMPVEVPGIVRRRGQDATFFPADERIKPLPIAREQASALPVDTLLVAKATKKQVEFTAPDGSVESVRVYQVAGGDVGAAPRERFVGVVDLVDGEAFVRDLVPPARLTRLPAPTPPRQWVEGDIVDVAMQGGQATVEATLAQAGTPKARVWLVAAENRLDPAFSPLAVQEAATIASTASASLADPALIDRRHEPFFAIDNPGSTDIDQAMRLTKRADGGFVVSYALADPSHYIKPGMALFEEAMQRGASYYLPGLSIPMLPATLSEGVVSLNAHEDHRAMIIQIRLDKDGVVEGPAEIQRALIRSHNQLTYGGVSAELEGQARIAVDERGQVVHPDVREQLGLFHEIGVKRIALAKARGVVEPDRREMVIGHNEGHFFLRDAKDDLASALNAELSILANVAGALRTSTSSVPGLFLPGIFRVHQEPSQATYRALARQVGTIVDTHQLSDRWRWRSEESLATWVDRIKTLPTTDREHELALVLQQSAVRINVASEYQREPGVHSGLKVNEYGRFSAPMREQVGLMSHAVLFAADALEKAVRVAGLSNDDAKALWAPLLLGAVVEPTRIPAARRGLASEAQALLSTSPAKMPVLARALATKARALGPLSGEEQRLVDRVFDRAMQAGNSSKMKQGSIDGAARKLLFDDLFLSDLGGNPLGSSTAPKRQGFISAVTPGKVYVQLRDPDVELRLGIDDLRRRAPGARFHMVEEACALVTDHPDAGPVGRLVVGAEVSVQATHHDGDRLHFTIVDP
jgi:ribonuclease R